MGNKTNFNPDGNLFVKGGVSSTSFLDVTGNATFGGDVTITGALQASGAITFLNDTQTVNVADGYVINSDSDVGNAYLQINSDVGNVRLAVNGNALTVGYNDTDNITLNANLVTLDGVANITGNSTLSNALITDDLEVQDKVTVGGNLDVTIGSLNIGTGATANVLTNARFTGVANTADKWHTPRIITTTLTGDVTGTGNTTIDGSGNISINIGTTTVESDAVALSDDTTGNYVATLANTSNVSVANGNSNVEGADYSIDLVDYSGAPASTTTYGNATHHMVFDLDTKGRVGNVAPVSANIASNQMYDFTERVRANVSASDGLNYNSSTGVFEVDSTVVRTSGAQSIAGVKTFSDDAIFSGNITVGNIAVDGITLGDDESIVLGDGSDFKIHHDGADSIVEDLGTGSLHLKSDGLGIKLIVKQGGTYYDAIQATALGVDLRYQGAAKLTTNAAGITTTGTANINGAYTLPTADGVADQVLTTDGAGSVTFGNPHVDLTSNQSIAGVKTFTNDVVASANVDLTGAVVTVALQNNTDATSKVASTQYVDNRINQVLGDAPAALDTLGEIANALIDDANVGNVLTAGIANIEGNTIFKNGNVAMTGDLDLGSQNIIALADPTGPQHGATKNYVDTTVVAANNALKANVDVNKVDKDFELQGSYAFILGTKLANGTLVTGDDSSLSNPNSANNAISFFNSDDTQNIFIRTRQFDHRYAILHQGAQGSGELTLSQERSGNLTVTGDVLFQRGIDGNANVNAEFNGAGTFTSISNMRHVKSANAAFAAGQSFSSNVLTSFYKNSFGSLVGSNTTVSATVISGSNLLVLTGNADTTDTYLGSETTGTLNAVASYNAVEVGVPRAHFQNFGKSTTFIGDFGNVATYTNVYDLNSNALYTTGNRPLERLTVDGALSLGARHTPANLLVNGTIFYDGVNNKLKGIQGNTVVDLVDATVTTIDLGDGSGDYSLATFSGSTNFLRQLSVGTGITNSVNAANVISISLDDAHVTSVARSALSSGSANLGYNNTTGVISQTFTTDDITEGTNQYFTNERVDDRVASLIVGGANVTATYDDAAGTLTLDADLAGDITGVTAGAGLTGGGTAGDVTLDVVGGTGITANANDIEITNTGVTAATYGTASQTPTFTVNAQGQLTAASQQAISITASQVSDFNEALEDRIGGGFVVGGANITVTYDDAANSFTIDADNVGDVTGVVAGSGLTGGGSAGDVTLNVIGGYGITASANEITLTNSEVQAQANVAIGNNTSDNLSEGSTNLYFTDERVDDRVNALIVDGDGITKTYNDGSNTYTLDVDSTIIRTTGNQSLAGVKTFTGNVDLSGATVPGFDISGDLLVTGNANIASSGELKVSNAYTLPTSDGTANQVLATDGAGGITFKDVTAIGGTVTGVTAGDGLTGGGVAGTVTLNTVGGYGITANANDIEVANVDIRGLFSAAGDLSYNASTGVFSFTNDAGDIEGVTAGTGLTGGGTSGTVTVSLSHLGLESLTDPNDDRILFWDDSAGSTAFLDMGTGLQISGATQSVNLGDFDTDNLSEGSTNLYFSNTRVEAVSINNVVEDTSPQLGGDLDVNGNNILYGDNEKAKFGDGPDLEIYHDGNDSFITDVGTGSIKIQSGTTFITNANGTKTAIATNSGAGQSIYYNNNVTLETIDGGAKVTGNLEVTGNFVTADTDNLSEGSTNLYYTVGRANTAIDARVTKSFIDALNVDAETLDGIDSASFLRSDAADSHTHTITPSADNSIDLGSSSNRYNEVYAVTFQGTATTAKYADLAENYLGDKSYEPGTVVEFGGSAEVTQVTKEGTPAVAGVVSTDPAHLMNAGLEGDNVLTVALRGRVPVKVVGPVRKGDVLIASSTPGHAKAAPFRGYQTPAASIVGKAIAEHRGMGEGVVEILV